MEIGESVLDCIDEELSFEDVEMMDMEEGQVVDGPNDQNPNSNSANVQRSNNLKTKKKRSKKKKKSKNKKVVPSSDGLDIDSFVLGVCKRLRERKTYLVYTAIGVLGVPALRDLVYAVQACGGQKTAIGDRYRSGGGILWNILKARDPNAYKEIMKKGKDFEKQFRRPFSSAQRPDASCAITSKPMASTSDDAELEPPAPPAEQLSAQPMIGEKRTSVHNRIRVPVSYDDLPGEEPLKEQSS